MAKIDPHRLGNVCTALGLLTQLLEASEDTQSAYRIARRLHVVADAIEAWRESDEAETAGADGKKAASE